jgi:hypothetical protein
MRVKSLMGLVSLATMVKRAFRDSKYSMVL